MLEVRQAARAVTSLDRPFGDEDSGSLGDLTAGESPSLEEEVTVSLGLDTLRQAVSQLPDRERDVVKMRYGLNGDVEPASLEEIGRRLVPRERAADRERGARAPRGQREIGALRSAA